MLECKTFLGSGDVVLERRYLVFEGKVSLPDTCSTLLIST